MPLFRTFQTLYQHYGYKRLLLHWLVRGAAIAVLAGVAYYVIYFSITIPSHEWNRMVFQPYFKKEIPVLGALLTFLVFLILGMLPDIISGAKHLSRVKHGCFLVRFHNRNNLTAVMLSSIHRIGNGEHLVGTATVSFPPGTQLFTDSVFVLACAIDIGADDTRYAFIPWWRAAQLEFTAGVAVKQGRCNDLTWTPLYRVLIDEGLIDKERARYGVICPEYA